jgi:hypothetical protein
MISGKAARATCAPFAAIPPAMTDPRPPPSSSGIHGGLSVGEGDGVGTSGEGLGSSGEGLGSSDDGSEAS